MLSEWGLFLTAAEMCKLRTETPGRSVSPCSLLNHGLLESSTPPCAMSTQEACQCRQLFGCPWILGVAVC